MAYICPDTCTAPDPGAFLPTSGCAPTLRDDTIARLVFIHCSVDTQTLIPQGSGESETTPAEAFTALATAWDAGEDPLAFVSPTGLVSAYEKEDDTEVMLAKCGKVAYVDGALTITMQFKQGWDSTITPPTAPGLGQYGEDLFFNMLDDNPAIWNFGYVTCSGELGYFMLKDFSDFANGAVSVKDITEDVNDCLAIKVYEVKVTFKCGARKRRMFTLLNANYDELIEWKV